MFTAPLRPGWDAFSWCGAPLPQEETNMQELTWQDAERILARNHRGRLACYSPSHDQTYVVPMSYRFHDGSIYLAMMPGQKLDFLHEHPQGISFEVDEITNDETWMSVVATGMFVDLKGAERETE